MAETSRTLEIILRAKDYFTRTFQTAGRAFISIVRGTFGLGFNALRSGLALVKSAVVGFAGIFASAFAASRASAFVAQTIEEADTLQKLATALGTTTERMSELQAAFNFSGVGADFEQTIKGLSKALSQVFTSGPDSRQGSALKQLGIDLNELRSSDPLDLLQGIAKGLEQYGSESERAAVLTGVFGDAFDTKLLVLLGRGEAEFAKNIAAAKLYGATLRGDLAGAAEAAGDQIGFLKLQIGTAFRDAVLQVAKALVPALTKMNEMLVLIRPALIEGLEALVRTLVRFTFWLAQNFVLALEVGIKVVDRLREALHNLLVGLNGIASFVTFGNWELFSEDFIRWIAPLNSEAAILRDLMEENARKLLDVQKRIEDLKRVGPVELGLGDNFEEALRYLNDRVFALKNLLADLAHSFSESVGDPKAGVGEASRALDIARLGVLREQITAMGELVALELDREGATEQTAEAMAKLKQQIPGKAEAAAADGFFSRVYKGFVDAAKTYADLLNEVQRTTTQLIQGSFSQIEDAFVSWITGAESFKEAFNKMSLSVLSDIARWIVHLQLLALWQSITSSFAGGGGSPSAQTPGTSPPPSSILPSSAGSGRGGSGLINLNRGFSRGGGGVPQFAGAGAGGGSVPQRSGSGDGGGPAGAPGTVNVTFNISAIDGPSVQKVLVEHRTTIIGMVRDSIATSRETRLAVRGASA